MIDQTLLAVDPTRFMRVLRDQLADVRLGQLEPFGPAGMSVVLIEPGRGGFRIGSVIVSQDDFGGNTAWIHASIAFEHEDPAYADLVALKAAVFGPDRWAYQVFAVATEHVSIHQHALHPGCRWCAGAGLVLAIPVTAGRVVAGASQITRCGCTVQLVHATEEAR